MNIRHRQIVTRIALTLLVFAGARTSAYAQATAAGAPSLEVYGFGQADAIVDLKQINPSWYDAARPSRLPKFENEFGQDGRFYLSVRQSRLGARGSLPTSNGNVTAQFEFDMFGVGPDAGVTTIRLRHAWGQWKRVGAGQTNSQFMDGDVFPNVVDYWGPNGMLFFRNVQVFFEPISNSSSRARIAIEAPGASGDAGQLADRVELQNVRPRFPAPDLTGNYRRMGSKGHVQVSGALRYLAYDDVLTTDKIDLNGHVWGWGLSGSSAIKTGDRDTLRLQAVYGEGIQNYFNDAPVDVSIKRNPGNAVTPVVGEALPAFGLMLFLDHNWNPKYSTAVGYSRVDITNSDGQTADAYKNGQYIVVNLLSTPAPNVLIGTEFQWIDRENNSDGFSSSDYRLQFTFKYSFSAKVGG